MESAEILGDVNNIFIKILYDNSIVLRNETTANDIEEWDSLTHIQLIVAIEKHFKVRFTSAEMRGFKNVGDMCRTVLQKLKQQ